MLFAAGVLALGVVGAGVDMAVGSDTSEPIRRSSTTVPNLDSLPAAIQGDAAPVVADDVSTPAPTETVPETPPETVQEEVARIVRQRATDNGINNVNLQVTCANTVLEHEGYSQEAVDNFLNQYLNPDRVASGKPWMYFYQACSLKFDYDVVVPN